MRRRLRRIDSGLAWYEGGSLLGEGDRDGKLLGTTALEVDIRP